MAQKQSGPTRRSFLKKGGAVAAALGIGGLAVKEATQGNSGHQEQPDETGGQDTGGGSDPAGGDGSESSDDGSDQVSQREQNIRNGIPLDGLGAYTDAVLQAEQPEPATIQQIDQMLEEKQEPGEIAENLAQILTTENTHSTMQYFHQQHQNQENTVVTNKNYGFTANSGPIIEVYTVTNGNLQPQPVLIDTYQGQTWETNKPGQQKPEYLADIRDSTAWARTVPQDWKGLEERIAPGNKEQKEKVRDGYVNKWSNGLFGINSNHNIIPHDAESSNVVFDGLYHNGDTQAVVELNNQYRESDLFDADTVVSAEFTGNVWEFHELPDYEMGEPLPAHQ